MTPLLLVTGFLGAGKTTFLRGLLPALGQRQLRARVVLNDFGDARVDAATLADVAPDLVALSGSCVCCESLDEMVAALAGLRCGPQEIVVVEANGGTEAGELVALLGAEPALDHLSPPMQLTVIDGKRFGSRGWQNVMEREQLATATHLALGRLDLISAARADEVRSATAAIAPHARWVTAETLAETLADIEAAIRTTPSRAQLGARIGFVSEAGATPHDHAWHEEPSGAILHVHNPADHFASLLLDLPGAIDAERFLRFLAGLPQEVLRAKGIVLLRDPPGEKRSFQKVDNEAEISPCELADPELLVPRAIFIGPHLPIAIIEAEVAALLAETPGAA
jgi:G3E family GTPase